MIVSWITPWGQLAWLRAYDDTLARSAYDTPTSHVIGGAVPSYLCRATRMFSSIDPYLAAATTANQWVCYDLEGGDQFPAPVKEKQSFSLGYLLFGNQAKRNGHGLIAAPGRDLVYVKDVNGKPLIQPGEDINDAYLRVGIPAACVGAAVLLVQSQDVQKDLTGFTDLLTGAKSQQADPNQALWAGLTTGGGSTVQQLADAYTAAIGVGVTGFWLTISSQSTVKVAADFLRWAIN
jgi:hypothetical protein